MRPVRFRPALVPVVVALASAPVWADPPTVLYRLGQASSFQEGCFGGCRCPVFLAGLEGTFGLVPAGVVNGVSEWSVSGIDWKIPELGSRVTGTGVFRQRLDPAPQQQLVLDLSIDGGPVERFDSGVVPAAAPFPRIDVVASQYGMQCYDRVFHVRAAPDGPVTFRFAGRVTGVFDGLGALNESVFPGASFRGSFTFDPDTPNSAPPVDEGEAGLYHHDHPPAGVRVRLPHLTFRSVRARPDFDVIVNNDFGFVGADEFGFRSRNNEALGLLPSAPVDRLDIGWFASTFTADPLQSAELPLWPPDLELLGGGLLTIYGECTLCLAPAAFFRIEGTLTSLTLPARLSVNTDALRWADPEGAAAWDILSGELAPASAGEAGQLVFAPPSTICLADDHPGTTLAGLPVPAPGTAIWFVARPDGTQSVTYDSYGVAQDGGRDEAIEAQGTGCP